MKKPLALRIDPVLLAAARECARRDNRTLTNFIETVLRRRVEEMGGLRPEHGAATTKEHAA